MSALAPNNHYSNLFPVTNVEPVVFSERQKPTSEMLTQDNEQRLLVLLDTHIAKLKKEIAYWQKEEAASPLGLWKYDPHLQIYYEMHKARDLREEHFAIEQIKTRLLKRIELKQPIEKTDISELFSIHLKKENKENLKLKKALTASATI